MNIFILNVGANSSHGALRSPIFLDKRFEFVPIPENKVPSGYNIKSELIPRYQNLFKNKTFISNYWLNGKAHNDPEFKTYTYGDYPTKSPRVFVMRHVREGDLLFFLARLTKWQKGRFINDSAFYLIGFFKISMVIKNIYSLPYKDIIDTVIENAHIKRAILDQRFFDGFWIFKGNDKSMKFDIAVPFDRDFTNKVMRDASGRLWTWRKDKTSNQTIGSYTRSCKYIKDKKYIIKFLAYIKLYNDLQL